MDDYVQMTAAELAAETNTTVDSWGLDRSDPVTIFSDGRANALVGVGGVLIADLAAGNTEMTARLVDLNSRTRIGLALLADRLK